MPCKYILQRGPNKGKACGRGKADYCKTHVSKPVVRLAALPLLVINNIVALVCNLDLDHKEVFGRLVALYGSCKDLVYAITPVWKKFYEKLGVSKKNETAMVDLTYLQRLHLLLDTGCQRCGTHRITKIYWPLPVRVCSTCIRLITVNEFALSKEYMVKNYNDDRFFTINYYNYGDYEEMRIYLIKHVETKIGCALLDAHLNNWKRNLAKELGISTQELTKHSASYKIHAEPSLATVSREYYSSIAIKQLPYANDGPVVRYGNFATKIATKGAYDSWLAGLATVLEDQRKHEYNKKLTLAYEARKNKMRRGLQSSVYFSKLDVEKVPGIVEFFRKGEDDTVESIGQRMRDGLRFIKGFVNENVVIIDTGNQNANGIANSIMRYPDKTPDVKQFVTAYTKSMAYESHLVDSLKIETWDDALELVKISKEKHTCEVCHVTMKHRKYLKHMYQVHESDVDIPAKDKLAWYTWLSKTDLPKLHGDGTMEHQVTRNSGTINLIEN